MRRRFPRRFYATHLKRVPGQSARHSNANLKSWAQFLRAAAQPGRREFLLLGDDPVPEAIARIPGVHKAAGAGLSLQLCLAGVCSGFLGMASGIAQAAVFSSVPYVIFKHPAHHRRAMRQELGLRDSFPFAGLLQKVWRRADSFENLMKALIFLENT